jgi:hypothetical protein
MANLGIDLKKVDETQTTNFEPVPNGIYSVQVTGSESKQNKAGTGSFLKIEFTVVDKNYNGRKFWHNFNLFNKSEKAQNIGRAELKRCILACGLSDAVRDSSEMHGKMLRVKIAIADQGGEYGLQNVIKDFYPIQSASMPASKPAEWTQAEIARKQASDKYEEVPGTFRNQEAVYDSANYPVTRPSWMAQD